MPDDKKTKNTLQTESSGIFKKNIEVWLESNIILTLFLTGLGYGIAYVFQYGQLLKYGIPASFIEITPTALVASIGFTIIVGIGILIYSYIYYDFEKNKSAKKWLKYILRTVIIVSIIVVVLKVLDLLYWKLIAFVIIIILLTMFVRGLVYSFMYKSFKKGFRHLFKSKASTEPNAFDLIPEKIMIFIFISMVSLILAFFTGSISVSVNSAKYMVLDKKDKIYEVVVLDRGSFILTKTINIETGKFEGGFEKKKLPEDKNIEYSEVKKSTDELENFLKQP